MTLKTKNNKVFLTGATGLLGSYLLNKFILDERYVLVLVRKKNNLKSYERVTNGLLFWNKQIAKSAKKFLTILEGDITDENFGLSKRNLVHHFEGIEEIYHCAATTAINKPLDEIRQVNVEGTKNLLEASLFSIRSGKLKKINHISTAFVCGNHFGIFKEKDLDLGQKFNSTYDKSKFEAEIVVNNFRKKGLWIDIFRPPIIIGDSLTGKIPFFKNIYQLFHLCELGIFDVLPLKKSFTYLAPIDLLSEYIYKISKQAKLLNQNYHVFSNKPILFENIILKAAKILNFKLPKLVELNKDFKSRLRPVDRSIFDRMAFFLNLNAKFDCSNIEKFSIPGTFSGKRCWDVILDKMILYYKKRGKK